jgi:phosphoserine aminotransferase
LTGVWSTKAANEASKYLKVNHVFPKPEKFNAIPDQSTWNLDPEAAYVYYCDNETVNGKKWFRMGYYKEMKIIRDNNYLQVDCCILFLCSLQKH